MSPEEEVSTFLLGLANGKYDPEIAFMDKVLAMAGGTFPVVLIAKVAIDDWLALNKATAPTSVIEDGRGGVVPFTNSRVMPDGSLRPYDPQIDGAAP
jgi:hypothetical protein